MKFIKLILITCLLGGCFAQPKHAANHQADTTALEKTFAMLEKSRVKAFRHQDWCKILSSKQGSFVKSTESTCTAPPPAASQEFNPEAQAEFDQIWQNLKSTRSGVYRISALRYDDAGKLIYGEFDCTVDFVRQRYVFDPGYTLPTDVPHEFSYTSINENWYYVREDWN